MSLRERLVFWCEENYPEITSDELFSVYQSEKELNFVWLHNILLPPTPEELYALDEREIVRSVEKKRKQRRLERETPIIPIVSEEDMLEMKRVRKGAILFVDGSGLMIYDGLDWKKTL